MRSRSSGSNYIVIVFLLLYGLVLPALLIQSAFAHQYIRGGVWRFSVRGGRLDYFERSRFDSQLSIARDEWRAASTIALARTDNRDRAEIRVSDANSCTVPWIGQYDYEVDRVRFNVCAMNWQGGIYPGTGENLGPTTISRRARTAVHEFGHALGLDHNPFGACNSVMFNDVPYDAVTCYIPEDHDRNDMANYWP